MGEHCGLEIHRRIGNSSHLFDDQLEHDLRLRFQIVDLDKLGLVQAVVRCQRAEQRVLPFVQRHWPLRVGVCHVDDGVVARLQVREPVAQHVLQPFGLLAVALGAICAAVLGFFLPEVQQELVV